MNKHFSPAISEEKFAAWLDGMLPADEMNRVGTIINTDNDFQSLLDVSKAVDAYADSQSFLMQDLMGSNLCSIMQNPADFQALETVPLTPIEYDFANEIVPTFLPDNMFPGDMEGIDMNDSSLESDIENNSTNM